MSNLNESGNPPEVTRSPPSQLPSRVQVIVGMTGSGKTTLMKKLMEAGPPRQLLLNTTGDTKFSDWGVSVESFEEMVDYAYRTDKFKIRWDKAPRTGLTIDCVSWLAMQRGEECGPVLVAVDEIQYYVGKQWNTIPKTFQDACLIGRHSEVYLIAASQRPALIHNDLLSQSGHWYAFRTVLRDDQDAIKHLFPTIREEGKDLPVGKYLTFP